MIALSADARLDPSIRQASGNNGVKDVQLPKKAGGEGRAYRGLNGIPIGLHHLLDAYI